MDTFTHPMSKVEKLKDALISCGYGADAAWRTALDLASFESEEHEDLGNAVDIWLSGSPPLPNVHAGCHTTASLVAGYGMSYPAALLTIAWLRADPAAAEACLASKKAV